MSDEAFMVKLEHVKEHENGDATYTFDLTETARDAILEDGLKLMLYCGVAKVDLQDVYDWILSQADKTEKETPNRFDEYGYYGENNGPLPPTEDIRPMTDEERQRAKEREEANKCSP